MANPAVLLVDVEASHEQALTSWCNRNGITAVSVEGAFGPPADGSAFALCILGLRGRSEDAFQRARTLMKALRGRPLVVLAEGTGITLAIRLIRMGISEVIELPAAAEQVVAQAAKFLALIGEPDGSDELVGQSPPMRDLRDKITAAARVDSTVLLQGETGTGKGLVARQIHARSPRRRGAFVHVDCAALSPTLIESELFGHEKGAFTGATGQRPGRFELAMEGTIFLDEIGDLDASLQSKLLRVLEDRCYERVGGTRTLEMRARVIAATSRDLREGVREGRFRQDLYFRLNVLELHLPPLRERLEDIPLLVNAGLQRLAEQLGVGVPEPTNEVYARLAREYWSGNVRELMNVLERLLVNQRSDTLSMEDLEQTLRRRRPRYESPDRTPVQEGDEVERIRAVLINTGGNLTRAARRLEMPRGTLRYKVERFGLRSLVPRD